MLVVRDVATSSRWYQDLVGLKSGHGGDEFEMLMSRKDALELMLHAVEAEEHPALGDPREGDPGRGVLLYFYVDDVRAAYERARAAGARLFDEPHLNPKSSSIEFSLTDPDGYALTLAEWGGMGGDDAEHERHVER